MSNIDYISKIISRQLVHNGKSNPSEEEIGKLYDEAVNLMESASNNNLAIVQRPPAGCNVKRSANFQVFYNEKEIQLCNKYFK